MTRNLAAVHGGDVVVAGLGSAYRHDDAVGAFVSERVAHLRGVRDIGPVGDPLELLGRWDGAALAIVVDAVHSGVTPGAIRVLEMTDPDDVGAAYAGDPSLQGPTVPRAPGGAHATSSHGIDVWGVLRLARALGRAPARVVLVGIEGEDFSPGVGLTAEVAAAVADAIGEVVRLIEEVRPCA